MGRGQKSTTSSRAMVGIADKHASQMGEDNIGEQRFRKILNKEKANKWLGPGQGHRRHACSQKDVGDAISDA